MSEPPGGEPALTTDPYACPDCGQPLTAVEGALNLLRCTGCGRESFVAVEDESFATDATSDTDAPRDSEEALNAARIRSFAAARRATYRSRSHALIAATACAVAVVQLIWLIVAHARRQGWGVQCTGYALFAALGLYGVIYFVARARELHREAKQATLPEPTTPPDFTTLDNGSKQWKNLEDVR